MSLSPCDEDVTCPGDVARCPPCMLRCLSVCRVAGLSDVCLPGGLADGGGQSEASHQAGTPRPRESGRCSVVRVGRRAGGTVMRRVETEHVHLRKKATGNTHKHGPQPAGKGSAAWRRRCCSSHAVPVCSTAGSAAGGTRCDGTAEGSCRLDMSRHCMHFRSRHQEWHITEKAGHF